MCPIYSETTVSAYIAKRNLIQGLQWICNILCDPSLVACVCVCDTVRLVEVVKTELEAMVK